MALLKLANWPAMLALTHPLGRKGMDVDFLPKGSYNLLLTQLINSWFLNRVKKGEVGHG